MTVTLIGMMFASPISKLGAGAPATPDVAFATASDSGSGLVITGYDELQNPNHPNVVIPSIIGGKTITSIGNRAFQTKQITSVKIPVGVTSIGQEAFLNNNLTSVEIPVGVTSISKGAFQHNSLTSVEIPDGVTSISNAFSYNQITSVTIPASLTSIEGNAFANNKLTSIEIPAWVTSIGDAAFGGNRLTSVNLPSSVTTVSPYAFSSQTPTVPYRLEGGKYTVSFSNDVDMNKTTLKSGSSYTLNKGKKEATSTTKTDLEYDYAVTYGTPEQTVTMKVTATLDVRTEFTVTYLGKDGASTLATEKVTSGNKATPPTPPAVAGYTFTGWDKDVTLPITAGTTFTAQYTVVKKNAAASNFTYTAPTLIYDGTAKSITVTKPADMGNITIKYAKKNGVGYDPYTSTAPTDAGEYKFSIAVAANANYNATTTDLTDPNWVFTIQKATVTAANFTYTKPTLTYDGSLKPITVTPPSGLTISDITIKYAKKDGTSISTAPTDAGEYKFSIAVAANANYNTTTTDLTDPNWVFTIQKATLTATGFAYTPSNVIYDETPKNVTITTKPNGIGSITIKYAKKNGSSYDTADTTAPTNAGKYKVSIAVADGVNYGMVNNLDLNGEFTIDQGTINNPIKPTGLNVAVGQTLHDVAGSMTVSKGKWSWVNGGESVGTVVGSKQFQATFTPDNTNYKTVIDTLSVTVKEIPTIVDFTYTAPTNLTYDAIVKSATVTTTATGMGAITVKYTRISKSRSASTTSTPPADAGTYKVLIDVAESTNYIAVTGLTDPAWNFTILPANLPTPPVQPTGLSATEGQTLKDVKEGMKVTDGEWTWDDPSTPVGAAGTNSFAATFAPTDTNYKTFGASLSVQVSTPTPGGGTNNPSNPGGSGGSWGPDGSWIPDGLQDFLATGDVMTRYIIYGFAILVAVSFIGLCVVISKRKSK